MARFLLDANVSHETGDLLRHEFQADVVHISSLGLAAIGDDEVVALAIQDRRIILTYDLDFGEMYRRGGHGAFGVVVLRLDVQTIEAANARLGEFLSGFTDHDALQRSLVVLEDKRFRIFNEPR